MPREDTYRRLQRHLDRMPVGFPRTSSGVEIRILQHLFTEEEARIALRLSAIPEPLKVIYRRLAGLRITKDAVRDTLDRMARKGVIERVEHEGHWRYGKSMFVVGMYERQLERLTPEFQRDTLQYLEEAFGGSFHKTKTTQLRTIPINKTVTPDRGVATYDSVRALVRQSDGPFAVMICICRLGKDLVDEPCRQTDVRDTCLTLGKFADHMVARGVAHFISRDEMLTALNRASQEGMVLQPQNTLNPGFICCCCGCCCGVLTTAKRLPRPADYFSTNFLAQVDPDTCELCGSCSTRCQMDALITADDHTQVDPARCIGCGLCVPTCPTDALRLQRKESDTVPPKDTSALYLQILKERYGPLGTAWLASRKLLGLKI